MTAHVCKVCEEDLISSRFEGCPVCTYKASARGLRGHAEAHKQVSTRLGDAHAYCQQFVGPPMWGSNVWHAILDDAVALREFLLELESDGFFECLEAGLSAGSTAENKIQCFIDKSWVQRVLRLYTKVRSGA